MTGVDGSPALAEVFASWATELRADSLPTDVVGLAQLCILDGSSLAAGAAATEQGRAAVDALADYSLEHPMGTIVIGHNQRLSGGDSALVNGILAHILQSDDGIRRAQGHPGASVVPAAIAAAQLGSASGAGLLRAVVGGYEVFARLGDALNPSHLQRGFHPSGTVGSVASSVAAGLALGLDATQLTNAIGLAGSVAGGLMEYALTGTMATYLVTGNAARVGVVSALLASRGFTGPRSIVEGRKGMAAAMADAVDLSVAYDFDRFRIRETYFKPYPSCRHTHAAIDAALRIVGEQGVSPDEVVAVTVESYGLAVDECDLPGYDSLAGADSSFQFAVASALRWGRFTFAERTLEAVNDPATRSIAAKVRVVHKPEFDDRLPQERPARVVVDLRGGTRRDEEVALARGEPETRLSLDEMRQKANLAASQVLGEDGVQALFSAIDRLPSANDLAEFLSALVPHD